ncbi:RING finger domain protein [Sclerotinia borealis F-4128]|uniref:RING finger domain protein n=1 Tax=Sclerotinia borealis (strain F-4128) TaxID=1432307 RepID=W9CKT6_SCLBF|nr:RING finger domain protein [Sclerotinia borealis F-4128]
MEELRLLDGAGHKDAGRLYRVAMEKRGIFGIDGVPIEYARAQTDTPAKEPWNHEWKRACTGTSGGESIIRDKCHGRKHARLV